MTTRAYDYILTVSDASAFEVGNVIVGASSNTVAEIVDISENDLKVRLKNIKNEFLDETIFSNTVTLTSFTEQKLATTADGFSSTYQFSTPSRSGYTDALEVYVDGEIVQPYRYSIDNTSITFNLLTLTEQTVIYPLSSSSILVTEKVGISDSFRFIASNVQQEETTASSEILNISSAPYIAEKNSQQQTPIVKMYTIYYPGYWYPTTANNNPNSGYAWPYGFPKRYAEIAGESYEYFDYVVSQNNVDYKAYAMESSDIDVDASGRIGEISLQLSNFDSTLGTLLEDSNIVGFSSNTTSAYVNGDLVLNIDPRTVADNVHYDSNVASARGANSPADYQTTIDRGETWTPIVPDSRDLLGGVVELRLTYAKFLDYWPEYSIVNNSSSNTATMRSSGPYRIGDEVTSNSSANTTTIANIIGNTLYFSNEELANVSLNDKILIINPDADSKAFVEHKFTIDRLDEMNDFITKFSLTNWTQFFKLRLPRRRYYRDKCPWVYKGQECQYPADGTGVISGTAPPISANGFFTANNVSTANVLEDVCAKTFKACSLRKNTKHFGGFPGVKK